MGFWDEKEAERLLQELPFHNASIEKSYITHLNNIDMLHELPFYNELNTVKHQKHLFKGYARSYNIEIINSKDAQFS